MKLLFLQWPFLPLLSLVTAGLEPKQGPDPGSIDPEIAAAKRLESLQKQYHNNVERILLKRHKTSQCTSKTILRRKEWSKLTKPERLSYITALKCLNKLTPPQSPATLLPGARNHLDDFIGSHLLRTPRIHYNGVFLPYHRHFLALFESALRKECNYLGGLPYWDWTLSWQNLTSHPMLDGSPTSLSGDGVFIPDRPARIDTLPNNTTLIKNPGTGGGCVSTGPFIHPEYILNLGPEQSKLYNPRCLSRDLHSVEHGWLTKPSQVSLLFDKCGANFGCFSTLLDDPRTGIHGAGHYQLGAEGRDVFVSPGDPAFWLHHANLDRIWAIWQFSELDQWGERVRQVFGTETGFNIPPSPNVTLDSPVDFGGVISPPRLVGDIISPIDGPHCYIYE